MSKYTLEIITAHNGTEILSIRSTEYIRTEFDEIRDAWREQQRKRNKPKANNINLLKRILRIA